MVGIDEDGNEYPIGAEPPGTREDHEPMTLEHFNRRWPEQFKCVQTVTIDFGPVSRTFTALLIVQKPGRFRLQGMTELGLKVFDLAGSEQGDLVIFKGDGINDQTIEGIGRDIRRVFLDPLPGVIETSRSFRYFYLEANTPRLAYCARLTPYTQQSGFKFRDYWSGPARLDRLVASRADGELFRFDQYDWGVWWTFDPDHEPFIPHVIVLRDSGRESGGPPYKLTIKITELTVRDTPWPEKTFKP